MKKILLVMTVAVFISACAPSQTAIQTAIAQTQADAPTNTAIPTNIPTQTNTPKSTNTPKPTNTPRPTATSTPVPEPIILSGTGDTVVDLSKWEGPALAHVIYSGGSNFAIWNYGPDGNAIDLLVNTIGRYEGTLPIDFLEEEQTTRFEITSSGKWEIQILPFEEIRRVDIPDTFDGVGDDVVYLQGTGRPDLLKVDASQAESNLAIWGYGNDRDLLVNEIAPYSGTVLVSNTLPTSNGALVLVIKATGNWSIEATTK